MSDIPATPECEKMAAIQETSQAIGDFIDWLQTEGMHICVCPRASGDDEFWPITQSIEQLLALYFKIDLKKVDQEKRALLEYYRSKQNES